ncbi:hypothetical protein, partial [Roseovarius sp.]|uniref:hypothetical protein n=1 Tax=Roseovarius sp. TaxID=1486281 RepID=UPI003564B069
MRIAAREQRHDMPPLRGHHQLLAISRCPHVLASYETLDDTTIDACEFGSPDRVPKKLFDADKLRKALI